MAVAAAAAVVCLCVCVYCHSNDYDMISIRNEYQIKTKCATEQAHALSLCREDRKQWGQKKSRNVEIKYLQ